jgi:hypothetical protein
MSAFYAIEGISEPEPEIAVLKSAPEGKPDFNFLRGNVLEKLKPDFSHW